MIVDLALAYLIFIAGVLLVLRGAKARNRAERAADRAAKTTADDSARRTR